MSVDHERLRFVDELTAGRTFIVVAALAIATLLASPPSRAVGSADPSADVAAA
jgi:hypothetical protein